MAEVSLYSDFLQQYINAMQFATLSGPQREVLKKTVEAGVSTWPMGQWYNKTTGKFLDEVPGSAASYPNPFEALNPDGTNNDFYLNSDAWETLYRDFANIFRNMHSDITRLNLTSATVKGFVNEFFSIDKNDESLPFGPFNFTQNSSDNLGKLLKYIANSDIQSFLITPELYGRPFNKLSEVSTFYNKLKNAIASGSFDRELRDSIASVCNFLKSLNRDYSNSDMVVVQKDVTSPSPKNSGIDLDDIIKSLEEEKPNSKKLEVFKGNFNKILMQLKAKPLCKKAFGKNGGSSVVALFDEAAETFDFDKTDSDNFIDPKVKDNKLGWEKWQKKIKDAQKNHLRKLVDRRLSHNFSEPMAEKIVDAMVDEEINPGDGLAGILAKKDGILKRLGGGNAPFAIGRAKWLFDQLEYLQPKMKSAFRDACKDGRQMNVIVQEIIKRAVKSGEDAKCSVALEILSVVGYGPLTSNTRDKIFGKDVNWTFIGDAPSMSKQPLKFMANAFDKSVKTVARVGFEAFHLGINKVRKLMAANDRKKMATAARLKAVDKELNGNLEYISNEEDLQHARNTNLYDERDRAEREYLRVEPDADRFIKRENDIIALNDDLKLAKEEIDAAKYELQSYIHNTFNQNDAYQIMQLLNTKDSLDPRNDAAVIAQIDAQISAIDPNFANKEDKLRDAKLKVKRIENDITILEQDRASDTAGRDALSKKDKFKEASRRALDGEKLSQLLENNKAAHQTRMDKYLELLAKWDFYNGAAGNINNFDITKKYEDTRKDYTAANEAHKAATGDNFFWDFYKNKWKPGHGL